MTWSTRRCAGQVVCAQFTAKVPAGGEHFVVIHQSLDSGPEAEGNVEMQAHLGQSWGPEP